MGVYGYEYYRRGKHDPLPKKGLQYVKKNFLKNFGGFLKYLIYLFVKQKYYEKQNS
jgi:hypothetical protein